MFQYVNNIEIRERGQLGIFREREIWYRGASGFYSIDYVDRTSQTVHGLLIYRFAPVDDGFGLRSVVDIPRAQWRGNHWSFAAESTAQILDEEAPRSEAVASDAAVLPESIDDFLEGQREPEELSYGLLRDRIDALNGKGIDASHYLVDLHLKLALPFANAILAFVAIPIAGRLRRHPSIAAIVGVGVAVGFLYWVILGLATSLGQTGTLPPLFAAWSALPLQRVIRPGARVCAAQDIAARAVAGVLSSSATPIEVRSRAHRRRGTSRSPGEVCRRSVPATDVANQRFEYCGRLRALWRPYFLRSTLRGSRVM
jgi:lipopolysaccharide export LptBFGC system permease protein LptF